MKKLFYMAVCLSAMLSFTSCNDDKDDPVVSDGAGFVHSVIVDQNSYMSVFKDLSVDEVDTKNSISLSKSASFTVYNDFVFVYERTADRLYKYEKKGNDIVQVGSVVSLPARSDASSICIVSDTKGFILYRGAGSVGVFNPQTMEIITNIELSEFSLGKDAGDLNPEPVAAIARDGKLFVFLWQEKAPLVPYEGAHAILVDIATNKAEKMISNKRATMLCGMPGAESIIDENGDIYVYAHGGFGYYPYSDGFLRIKKGETDFDPDYFFPVKSMSIEGIPGNKADYVNQYVYTGAGVIYGYINVPGNASIPADYTKDKTLKACKINLYNKSVTVLKDVPFSPGWSSCLTLAGTDEIVFGLVTDNGSGYFLYNYKSNKFSGRIIKSTGIPYRVSEF